MGGYTVGTVKKKTPLSEYSDEELFHEVGLRLRARQTHMPNPKVQRKCPKGCGKKFGAREMRAHIPKCEGKK